MSDPHDIYFGGREQRAVDRAERNPTEFINFTVTGDTEGLSAADSAYIEAVRKAYSDAVEDAYRTVQEELGGEERAE